MQSLSQEARKYYVSPDQNHLLAALSNEVQHRLFPHMDLVFMPCGQSLYESGDKLCNVYFPTDCIVSLLYEMEDGASSEIAMVGNEGLVGMAIFMGDETTLNRAIVQTGGSAYRIPKHILKAEFVRHGEFLDLVLRYAQILIAQVVQIAACNRHHTIEQQVCRCLLSLLDRLSGNNIVMTHELMANMLGVRRESVTEAVGKLRNKGVIIHSRRHITVLNHSKLEELSCECYRVVKQEFDRLLPRPVEPLVKSNLLFFQPRPHMYSHKTNPYKFRRRIERRVV